MLLTQAEEEEGRQGGPRFGAAAGLVLCLWLVSGRISADEESPHIVLNNPADAEIDDDVKK